MKSIFTKPIVLYPFITLVTVLVFAPFILLGAYQGPHEVWVWEGSHEELPMRLEFGGNVFIGDIFTLISYEGSQMVAPLGQEQDQEDEDSTDIWFNSWLKDSPYTPRAPWRTRNVNEEIQLLDTPTNPMIFTTANRLGFKAGFRTGVTKISVSGNYVLNNDQLILTFSNGNTETIDIKKTENTITIGDLTFVKLQID